MPGSQTKNRINTLRRRQPSSWVVAAACFKIILITSKQPVHTLLSSHTHRFSDPHMEVVEVRVAAIGLPAVLSTVLVASDNSDGVQRVGLTVVITNPCSTPESRETSVSYPAQAIHPKWVWRLRGWMKPEERKRAEKERKVCAGSKCEGKGRASKRKKVWERDKRETEWEERRGTEGGRKKEEQKNSEGDKMKGIKNTGTAWSDTADIMNRGRGETLKEKKACREARKGAKGYPVSKFTHSQPEQLEHTFLDGASKTVSFCVYLCRRWRHVGA